MRYLYSALEQVTLIRLVEEVFVFAETEFQGPGSQIPDLVETDLHRHTESFFVCFRIILVLCRHESFPSAVLGHRFIVLGLHSGAPGGMHAAVCLMQCNNWLILLRI
jgi:hypothetical protein